jgi:hypothetical protein
MDKLDSEKKGDVVKVFSLNQLMEMEGERQQPV